MRRRERTRRKICDVHDVQNRSVLAQHSESSLDKAKQNLDEFQAGFFQPMQRFVGKAETLSTP